MATSARPREPPFPEEAAMVDGTTRVGALFKVVVPLSTPGLFAAGIYTFLQSWNAFMIPLIFTSSALAGGLLALYRAPIRVVVTPAPRLPMRYSDPGIYFMTDPPTPALIPPAAPPVVRPYPPAPPIPPPAFRWHHRFREWP